MKSKISSLLAICLTISGLIAFIQAPALADKYIKRCNRNRHGRLICHSERIRTRPSTRVNIRL